MGDQSKTLSERLKQVATGHVYDALAHVGVSNVVMSGLRRMSERGLTMAGPAATVELVRARTPDAPRGTSRFFREVVPPGSVVVVACHGLTDRVCVGGRAALAMRRRGAVGAVVDGGVRDADELYGEGFPLYAAGYGLAASEGFLEGIRFNETVYCAGVKVDFGDFIVADDTGVIVVPKAVVERVTQLAEERDEIDRDGMKLMAEGATVEATHRHFKDDDPDQLRSVE